MQARHSLQGCMDEPAPLTLSTDRFAWQYAYTARLVYLGAPATPEQLQGLAAAAYIAGKRHDPVVVADLAWRDWPSEEG